MFQVCIHGRGGQGVVTASELLARAAFIEGHQVQAIPSFGSERTGAPVVSYCRLATDPILTREPILAPDAVIVQDPTLLGSTNVFEGMASTGWAVVNTRHSPNDIMAECPDAPTEPGHLATVPADDIVREYLGRPIPSAALLGAFAALTGQISLNAVLEVIATKFRGKVATGNSRSAEVAYQWVVDHVSDPNGSSPVGGYPFHSMDELPSPTELEPGLIGTPEVRNA